MQDARRCAIVAVATFAVLTAAPPMASAQVLGPLMSRMSRGWAAQLPVLPPGAHPGLVASGDPIVVMEGEVSAGSILARARVKHGVTGVVRPVSGVGGRYARTLAKLAGAPVFAVRMGAGETVWCRWEPSPRRSWVPGLDPVETGQCFPVVKSGPFSGVAHAASVFAPEGLYVSKASWAGPEALLPGFRVELADVALGGDLQVVHVLERVTATSFVVVHKVTWDGGEVILGHREAPLPGGGRGQLTALGGVAVLERGAAGAEPIRLVWAKRPTSPPEGQPLA